MNKTIFKIRPPFEILPPFKSYQHHSNSLQSQKFPNCCEWHKNVYKVLCDRFESDFRLFAERVKEETKIELDISDYSDTPKKIVTQLCYTEYYISQTINKLDWYRYFLHYIDYNVYSFGHPDPGGIWYLEMVELFLESIDDQIDSEKKHILIEELKYRINTDVQGIRYRPFSNPKLVHDTIRKWLELLPFKSGKLKSFVEEDEWKSLTGINETNHFDSRIITTIPFSVKELIGDLKAYTRQLLKKHKAVDRIKNADSIKPDEYHSLLNKEIRGLKQNILLNDFNPEEIEYVEILEEWLANEKAFIDEKKTRFGSKTNSARFATFETNYEEWQLIEMRSKLIAQGYISKIPVKDFMYLFQKQPVVSSMKKIIWKSKRSIAYYFFKRAVYAGKRFSSSQVNRCIKFKGGEKMHGGCKSGEYSEIDDLLPEIEK